MGRNRCWTSCYDASNAKGRRPLANPAGPKAAGAHPAGASRAGKKDPPLTLRGKPDNGTCPAMPGAAGPGNGAAHKRAAAESISLRPFG